jgi:soluble P-type ATPase
VVTVEIPSGTTLELSHLVCDFNGTLSVDGVLLPGVRERVLDLSRNLDVHVVTADTFGRAQSELSELPVKVLVLPSDRQTERKIDYIQDLGTEGVVAIGNGNNDAAMLEAAALGICVVQGEGASVASVMVADVVCGSVLDALDLLIHPMRLVATLRS